ncbi:helix-turn-helix transcriptional regulator [Acutalibacter sp. JLR.KK004]|jgi:transcriptional regulator with XRE-family HTH domain|uniref:helix-turn-helix domain-containing protein n=1 Tax=Acutalibacter sp. JLR.KK004 TaxID=3112622 RepID=UPI00216F2251|nr:helix-turn-helix transcriptional regulator [Bacillota bacterium]MCI9116586.1 helix-turn-helix transcriptional regulator [Acutalibacter sp.]
MYYDVIETGRRIQKLRKGKGLTQEQLASLLKVTDRHIRSVESGERNASIDLLVSLSDIFNVSLDYLILGKQTWKQMKEEIHAMLENLSAMVERL